MDVQSLHLRMLTIFDLLLLRHAGLVSLTDKSLHFLLLAYLLVLDQDPLCLAHLLSSQLHQLHRFAPVDLACACLTVPQLLFDPIAFFVLSPWPTATAISSDPASPSALL